MNEMLWNEKLSLWKTRLLDAQRPYTLISYQESSPSALKILSPGFDELYQRMVVNGEEALFHTAFSPESDFRVYAVITLMDALGVPMDSLPGMVRVPGNTDEIEKTLENFRMASQIYLERESIHSLYLAFGFLEWRESGSESIPVSSPLILVPATLARNAPDMPMSLKKLDDEIIVNPALASLFSERYSLDLPEFDGSADIPDTFLREMESLAAQRDWKIHRECVLGLMPSAHAELYQDLTEYGERFYQHPVFSSVDGSDTVSPADASDVIPSAVDSDVVLSDVDSGVVLSAVDSGVVPSDAGSDVVLSDIPDPDSCPASENYPVLETDSSQADAVELSRGGKNFILYAPPGTGKTQTVVNIIASALADRKSVLFVSEKSAALEKLGQRLSEAHLSEFSLTLSGGGISKQNIIAALASQLENNPADRLPDNSGVYARLDAVREPLREYVRELHLSRPPVNKSLYDAFGIVSESDNLPEIVLPSEQVSSLSESDVNHLCVLVSDLEHAQQNPLLREQNNPWNGIVRADASDREKLQEILLSAVQLLENADACKWNGQAMSGLVSMDNLPAWRKRCERAEHAAEVPREWLKLSDAKKTRAIQTLEALAAGEGQPDSMRQALVERYGSTFAALDGIRLRQTLDKAVQTLERDLYAAPFPAAEYPELPRTGTRLRQLQEQWTMLTDAYAYMCETLDIRLPPVSASIDTLLTLCAMLEERRPLTEAYFNADTLNELKRITQQTRRDIAEEESRQKELFRRYDKTLTDSDQVAHWLSVFRDAKTRIPTMILPENGQYSVLSEIAALDSTSSVDTAALMTAPAQRFRGAYGIRQPETLEDIRVQRDGLKALDAVGTVFSWESRENREQARHLLRQGEASVERLRTARHTLTEFFDRYSFDMNADDMKPYDISILRQLCTLPPHIRHMAETDLRGEMSVARLLDEIRENQDWLADIHAGIHNIKEHYQFRDGWNDKELAEFFMECGPDAQNCAPRLTWAENPETALSLLERLETYAENLNSLYDHVTERYDPSALEMDFAPMLERFRNQYTGLFIIMKQAYRDDVKQIRRLQKANGKTPDDTEIVALLESVRIYQETTEQYLSLSGSTARLLGVGQYDFRYDWTAVRKRIRTFLKVTEMFETGAAAYAFVTSVDWQEWMGLMSYEQGLSEWFDNNTAAQDTFGPLYLGVDTDTKRIYAYLERIHQISGCFAAPENFLTFLTSDEERTDADNALKALETVSGEQRWFMEHETDFHTFGEMRPDDPEQVRNEVLLSLENYESLVKTFGDESAWKLVHDRQNPDIGTYAALLDRMLELEHWIQAVCRADLLREAYERMKLPECAAALETVCAAARDMISVYAFLKPFAGFDIEQESVDDIGRTLEDAAQYQEDTRYLTGDHNLQTLFGTDYQGTRTDWTRIESHFAFCEEISRLCGGAIPRKTVSTFVSGASVYSEAKIARLREAFTDTLSEEQAYPALASCQDITEKSDLLASVFAPLKKIMNVRDTVNHALDASPGYPETLEALSMLAQAQEAEREYEKNLAYVRKNLSFWNPETSGGWSGMLKSLSWLEEPSDASAAPDTPAAGEASAGPENMRGEMPPQEVWRLIENLSEKQNIPEQAVMLFAPEMQAEMRRQMFAGLLDRFRRCLNDADGMNAFLRLWECQDACREAGLDEFIRTAQTCGYPAGRLDDVFRKNFWLAWIRHVTAQTPAVSDFRAEIQNRHTARFRKLDQAYLLENQRRIRAELFRRIADETPESDEAALLRREHARNRNALPLWKLFRQMPGLLLRLRPCVLMSPLSVPAYLDPDVYMFDLVIVDDASHILPQNAVSAVSRGKQVIFITTDNPAVSETPESDSDAVIPDSDTVAEQDAVPESNSAAVPAPDSILQEVQNDLPVYQLRWLYQKQENTDSNGLTVFPAPFRTDQDDTWTQTAVPQDWFVRTIGHFLRQEGWRVQQRTNDPSMLALTDPDNAGQFLGAVLCDGYAYAAARSVRDREIVYPMGLRRMGWHVFRTWSAAWVQNPEAEQERIRAFLRRCLNHEAEPELDEPEFENTDQFLTEPGNLPPEMTQPEILSASETVQPEILTAKNTNSAQAAKNTDSAQTAGDTDFIQTFPLYRKWRNTAPDGQSAWTDTVLMNIIQEEQPVHREVLYRRMAELLGSPAVTSEMQSEVYSMIISLGADLKIQDGFIQTRNFKDIQVRRSPEGSPDRTIEQISIPEIALAMEAVLKHAPGIKTDRLNEQIMRIFGFTELTPAILRRIGRAADKLTREGKLSAGTDGTIRFQEGKA